MKKQNENGQQNINNDFNISEDDDNGKKIEIINDPTQQKKDHSEFKKWILNNRCLALGTANALVGVYAGYFIGGVEAVQTMSLC